MDTVLTLVGTTLFLLIVIKSYKGCYPLERSVTAIRGRPAGDTRKLGRPCYRYTEARQPMGGTRAGTTFGSHTGTGTDPTSTDGRSGEGSDGRSGGVWRKSSMK